MSSPPVLLLWTADPRVVRSLESVAGEQGLEPRRTDHQPAEAPAVVVIDLDAPGAFDALVDFRERWPEALVAGHLGLPDRDRWLAAERAGCDLVANRGALFRALRTRLAAGAARRGRLRAPGPRPRRRTDGRLPRRQPLPRLRRPLPPRRGHAVRRRGQRRRRHLSPPRQPVRRRHRRAPAGPGRHRHRHLAHRGRRRPPVPARRRLSRPPGTDESLRVCASVGYAPSMSVPDALIDEAARRFALLSDPTRLRLLAVLLEREPMTVTDLAEALGIAAPNVSQHL